MANPVERLLSKKTTVGEVLLWLVLIPYLVVTGAAALALLGFTVYGFVLAVQSGYWWLIFLTPIALVGLWWAMTAIWFRAIPWAWELFEDLRALRRTT